MRKVNTLSFVRAHAPQLGWRGHVVPDATSHPRLRGATALVAAQQFAAPRVA